MTFVDFMIIGAQKCGTTTLAEILANHPDICFSKIKEPHFFSKDPNWRENLEDYQRLFFRQPQQICGEASTTYTCSPEFNPNIWQAIYDFNPNLKLIYIMRNPMDRIISHYMHNYLKGYTSDSLENVIFNDATYLNRTRYFVQIQPYINKFGKDKIFLLTLEEFLSKKTEMMIELANFLSVDHLKFSDSNIHKNKSLGETKNNVNVNRLIAGNNAMQKAKHFVPKNWRKSMYNTIQKAVARKIDTQPTMSDALKEAVWNFMKLDIIEIEKLMGRKLLEWKY